MSAHQGWSEDRLRLLAAAAELGVTDRDTIRVADLLLARVLAARLGLLAELGPVARLADDLAEVALFPLPRLARGRARRTAAVDAAASCASHMEEEDLFHVWSESSQAGDPGRKGRGAFSTPPTLARVIAEAALEGWDRSGEAPLAIDPSAGHGALLLSLFDALRVREVEPERAVRCLHGVELDPHARELCCLILWLRAASREIGLADVASQIVLGNALTAVWLAEGPRSSPIGSGAVSRPSDAFAWETVFPRAFVAGGFDLVVANPPWDSLRHFHSADPDDWIQRDATRALLSTRSETGRGLPQLFSAQGRGDRNLYKGFVELFPHLLALGGRLVALLPGAFCSDFGMQDARRLYLQQMELKRWTSFENLAHHFPIDGRYKFGILVGTRSEAGTSSVQVRFMAREADEACDRRSHLKLSRGQIRKLGGRSEMFPEVTSRPELAVLERAVDHGSRFFDGEGSFGQIEYRRELDLTVDRKAGQFIHVRQGRRKGFRALSNGEWSDGSETLVPLIEGRMISSWDFFEKSWMEGRGRSARWRVNETTVGLCRPQFLVRPLASSLCRLAICDVTSATNTRTMRASWVPSWPCGNTAPVLSGEDPLRTLALLAVLNSMTFDWILRRLAAGLHLNRFYLEAMPLPTISTAELTGLAAFAATSMLEGKRCRSLARREVADLRRAAAAATSPSASEVEVLVADGYGLDPPHLRRVLDASPADRKGLWRYYAAVPEAERVAAESIRLLEAA